MKICHNCKTENRDTAKFCPCCGERISEIPAVTATPTTVLAEPRSSSIPPSKERPDPDLTDRMLSKLALLKEIEEAERIASREMDDYHPKGKIDFKDLYPRCKGAIYKLRCEYLKGRINEGARIVFRNLKTMIRAPPDIIYQSLVNLPSEPVGNSIFEVDALEFMKYSGNIAKEYLPDSLALSGKDFTGNLVKAYWTFFKQRPREGTPEEFIEQARKLVIPVSGERRKGYYEAQGPAIKARVEMAYAYGIILKDDDKVRAYLKEARDLLDRTYHEEFTGWDYIKITDGSGFVDIGRGYLEILGDGATAEELVAELTEGQGRASASLELATLLLDLGEVEKAKGVLEHLNKMGNVHVYDSIRVSMNSEDWHKLAFLWLDVGNEKMASIAIDASGRKDEPAGHEPSELRTMKEMAVNLFKDGK